MKEKTALTIAATMILIASFSGGFYAGHEYAEWSYKARIAKVFEHAAEIYGKTNDPQNNLQREAR